MADLTPTVEVAVELAGMGAGWTVLPDVIREASITITRGIQGSGPSDRVAEPSSAHFSLRNDSRNSGAKLGYYSLHHANKRAGWALNIGCRIRLQDPATSTYYTEFIGKIDEIDVQPWVKGQRRAMVTALGWLDEAARWAITPEIGEQVQKRGNEVLTAILAEMPVQPVATSFDQGKEIYPFALDRSGSGSQPALTEFQRLAASEFGYIYENRSGTLRYENRHARLLTTSSAWTLNDSVLSAPETGLDARSSRDDILNLVRVTAHPRIVDENPTTIVYDQANPIRINAGATQILIGEYRDPVSRETIGATDIQNVVGGVLTGAGTDYIANSDETGGGSDLTSSLTITVNIGQAGVKFTVVNVGTVDAFLTTLQLRGRGIFDRGTVNAEASDAGSISTYGERDITIDMPYQSSLEVAQGAASLVLADQSAEVARARSLRVVGRDSATLTQLLTRDISDRITVQETVTGFNNSFFINGLELTVLPSGHLVGTYIPAYVRQVGYWLLGTSTLGTDTTPAPF